MSINRNGKVFLLICDCCGEIDEDDYDDFDDAVKAKKENGWTSRCVNGSWEDWCPDCTQEEIKGWY